MLLSPSPWVLIRSLQVGLEYLLVDSRTFVTNEEGALRTFFGATVDSSTSYRVEIEVRRLLELVVVLLLLLLPIAGCQKVLLVSVAGIYQCHYGGL